jgi:hypothetical protein
MTLGRLWFQSNSLVKLNGKNENTESLHQQQDYMISLNLLKYGERRSESIAKSGMHGAMDALFEECKAFTEEIRGGKRSNKIFNSEDYTTPVLQVDVCMSTHEHLYTQVCARVCA